MLTGASGYDIYIDGEAQSPLRNGFNGYTYQMDYWTPGEYGCKISHGLPMAALMTTITGTLIFGRGMENTSGLKNHNLQLFPTEINQRDVPGFSRNQPGFCSIQFICPEDLRRRI
jgi:hypothetical protein